MGGAFSCSTSACQYNKCLDVASFIPTKGNTSCRFSAEIFKLSEDHLQWTKVHPRVLSVTVSRKADESGRVPILELNAADLEEQQNFSLPISEDSEMKRYSDRFVYWKANEKEIFALNVVSGADVDRLFLVASPASRASCLTTSASSTSLSFSGVRVNAHAAPILAIRHGMVVQSLHLTFTKSVLCYDPPDSLRVLDEQDNCLFTTPATECVISMNKAQLILCLSFPSRALVLQFAEPEPLRSFCETLLNESSMYLAKSRELSTVIAFLQHRLDLVSLLINELPFSKRPPCHSTKPKCGSKKPSRTGVALQSNQYTFVPSAAKPATPTFHGTVVPPIVGVLYTLKYMLIYRIASIKNMLPYSDFVDVLYPPELSTMINSSEKCYLAHFIHLSCILHCCFSIPKHLEFIAARRVSRVSTSHPQSSNKTPAKPLVVEEKLSKVVLELVHTEELFLQDLHQLLVQYVGPAELKCLECVQEVYKTHLHLLDSLKDTVGDLLSGDSLPSSITLFPYTQIKDIVLRISALFINKCNKFKVYSEYASAHLQFQRLQKDNQQLCQLLHTLNVKGQQSTSAESLIIKPIQRILKYPLFLAQIKENCPVESMERRQCSQALDRMQMLATYINEMQRIQEEYGEELDKTFLGEELSNKGLRVDLRDLLMFAQLKWLQAVENNYIDCVAFVFKFFILLMEKGRKGQLKKDYPAVVLPIWRVEVSESVPADSTSLQEGSSSNYLFSLLLRPINPNESGGDKEMVYYLSCCHLDIKDHFIRSVNKGLKASIKQKLRPTSGQSSQSDWGYASGR